MGKILTTKCLALKAGRGKSLQALPVPPHPTTLFLKTWRNARIPRAPLQSGISTPWINVQAVQSVSNVANLFRGKVGHQLPWRPTCETSTTECGTDTKKRWRSVTKKRWFSKISHVRNIGSEPVLIRKLIIFRYLLRALFSNKGSVISVWNRFLRKIWLYFDIF